MREAILILIVIAVLFGLTAYRYRRQLSTMLHLWRMMRSMRTKMNAARENRIEEKEDVDIGNLVNCSKCGTWVPEMRAIGLGKKTFYCSTVCLEKSARVN